MKGPLQIIADINVRGPNNIGRAVQTDQTLFRHCTRESAQKSDRFSTLRNNSKRNCNNMQQHATGCANGRNM